jgi:hypothetical protein
LNRQEKKKTQNRSEEGAKGKWEEKRRQTERKRKESTDTEMRMTFSRRWQNQRVQSRDDFSTMNALLDCPLSK